LGGSGHILGGHQKGAVRATGARPSGDREKTIHTEATRLVLSVRAKIATKVKSTGARGRLQKEDLRVCPVRAGGQRVKRKRGAVAQEDGEWKLCMAVRQKKQPRGGGCRDGGEETAVHLFS